MANEGNEKAVVDTEKNQEAEIKTAEQLHDEAISAHQAYLSETDETKKTELKTVAETLSKSAKETFKSEKQKAIDEAKAASVTKPKAPEKYDLKLPEGSKLDATHLDRIAAESKARGLSQEDAQALVERDSKMYADFNESQQQEFETRKKNWADTLKNDKEIGGDNLKKNDELATRVIEHFSPDKETTERILKSGLLMEPSIFKLVLRIGKSMGEDKLIIPGSTEKSDKKSAAEVLYGGTTQ